MDGGRVPGTGGDFKRKRGSDSPDWDAIEAEWEPFAGRRTRNTLEWQFSDLEELEMGKGGDPFEDTQTSSYMQLERGGCSQDPQGMAEDGNTQERRTDRDYVRLTVDGGEVFGQFQLDRVMKADTVEQVQEMIEYHVKVSMARAIFKFNGETLGGEDIIGSIQGLTDGSVLHFTIPTKGRRGHARKRRHVRLRKWGQFTDRGRAVIVWAALGERMREQRFRRLQANWVERHLA